MTWYYRGCTRPDSAEPQERVTAERRAMIRARRSPGSAPALERKVRGGRSLWLSVQ